MNFVLVIGAHIDDESFGMGGTIYEHTQRGDVVDVLTITDSCSVQYKNKNWKKMMREKQKQAKKVMDILGVRRYELNELPEMTLDISTQIDVNRIIGNKIESFDPDIVYTHFSGDLNSDHRYVFKSTMVACRPIEDDVGSSNRKIISYEVPSSSEWSWMHFNPNMYASLSSREIDKKMQAVHCYESEIRDWPHPRSRDAIYYQMKHHGSTVGCFAAERFKIIREVW